MTALPSSPIAYDTESQIDFDRQNNASSTAIV